MHRNAKAISEELLEIDMVVAGWLVKKDDIAREVLKYCLILHTRGVKTTTRRRPTVTSDLNPGPNRMVTPKSSNATSMKPTKKLSE